MISSYKILGQAAPLATTETLLYTTPASQMAVLSSVVVANRAASSTSFRISISVAGAATSDKDYIYYDVPIPANETFIGTIGLTLNAGDVIRVYAGSANLSFSVWGSEVSSGALGVTGPAGATGPTGPAGPAGPAGGGRENSTIDANTRVWLPMNSTFGATGAINYGSLGGTWGASNTLFGNIGVFTCAAVATNGAGQLQSPDAYFQPSGPYTLMSWLYLDSYYPAGSLISRLLLKKAYPGTAWIGLSIAGVTLLIGFTQQEAYSYIVYCPSGTTGTTFVYAYANRALYPLNTWMHVATVFDGQYFMLYRNGVLVGSTGRGDPRSPGIIYGRLDEKGQGPWVIGPIPGAPTNEVMLGRYHDVRMEEVARTQEELFEIYKKGTGLA